MMNGFRTLAGAALAAVLVTPAYAQDTTAPVSEATAPAAVDVSAPAADESSFSFADESSASSDALSQELDALLKDDDQKLVSFGLKGYYRVRGIYLDQPDLSDTERPHNLSFMQHRLWLSPEMTLNKKPAVKLTADILVGEGLEPCSDASLQGIHTHPCTGMWGTNGDNLLDTNSADQVANITVARLWGEALTPVGVIRLGRQPSHWGLGLFSNDGQHKQWFGDNHRADTYDRLAFATKPMGEDSNLIVALVGDKIVEGSPTLSATGHGNKDDVLEAIGLVLYNTDPLKLGFYQVFRKQVDTSSQVHISDIYGYLDIGLLYGGFEMFWLYGKTEALPIVTVQSQVDLLYPEVKLNVWSWAAELGLRGRSYDGLVRFGSAGGDNNETDDREVQTFTLNSNYRAGLIMWDYANANRAERVLQAKLAQLEYLRDNGRATQNQINEVLKVADLNRTRGGINNAFFVNPVVNYKLGDSASVRGGVLWAQANDDIFLIGYPNQYSPVGRNYGWEFDIGADYNIAKSFSLGFEGAYLLPGDAFNRVESVRDPASGQLVPIAGSLIKPDHARLAMLRATWNIDY